MNAKKEYIGFDSKTFRYDGIRYRVQMMQLHKKMTPQVSIWIGGDVLLSKGEFNGLSYINEDEDAPVHHGNVRAAINACCALMVV